MVVIVGTIDYSWRGVTLDHMDTIIKYIQTMHVIIVRKVMDVNQSIHRHQGISICSQIPH